MGLGPFHSFQAGFSSHESRVGNGDEFSIADDSGVSVLGISSTTL